MNYYKNMSKEDKKQLKENFKNEIIDFADNAEDLDKKEKFWIAYFKSNTENNGYNKIN